MVLMLTRMRKACVQVMEAVKAVKSTDLKRRNESIGLVEKMRKEEKLNEQDDW